MDSKKALLSAFLALAIVLIFLFWLVEIRNLGFEAKKIPLKKDADTPIVLYINSYDKDHHWSAGIERGILNAFEQQQVELETIEMKTKQDMDKTAKEASAKRAQNKIERIKPAVIITSGDAAFNYVVTPFYKNADIPIIFNSINWDIEQHGGPYENTVGIIKTSPAKQLIEYLQSYTQAENPTIGYLSSKTGSDQTNIKNYQERLNITFEKTHFVATMSEWKTSYKQLQEEVDILLFETTEGINNWNQEEAKRFAQEHIKIPIGTTSREAMQTALIGITNIPEEHGEWSGQIALQIIESGTDIKSLGVVKDKKRKIILNLPLADKLNVVFSPIVIRNADIIDKEGKHLLTGKIIEEV